MSKTVALISDDVPAPITTVTFYSVEDAAAAAVAKDHLQSRLDTIVQLNPWLTGRIVTGAGSHLMLSFDPTANAKIVIEDASMPSLSAAADYKTTMTSLAPLEVLKDKALINNAAAPVFRATWITIAESSSYALVVSLSHAIGDGFTYYRIYGMLSASTDAAPLTILESATTYAKIKDQAYGDTTAFLNSLAFKGHLVKNMGFGTKPTAVVRSFNPEWLASAKKTPANGVPYLSTNDVVTSWFFAKMGAKIGLMDINFRGRVAGVDKSMAGNYEFFWAYQPEDFASPSLIRESLAKGKRARSGNFPWMSIGSTAYISSWASLYEPLVVPGLAMTEHLPCVHHYEGTPFTDFGVVFQRTPADVGIVIFSRNPVAADAAFKAAP
ncbi:Aste57867_484 [Aphanomyces stellatus]|uniref:Aste57867_484 protein n=1 Tax=Aphanomyces stellatus TaxID=120398 RepID=A0A485K7X7_9STRA|nr:hypothetical protein As57867_000483 [Aphanomyces stellatus]VFT77709.1 Aste57867_484 [Aphanomyces stellatus]